MAIKKDWAMFHHDIDVLIEMMGSYRPDIIVPLMVGGLVPAAIISEKLKIRDLRPISIEREGDIRRIVYDIQGVISLKDILFVEDDVPSGKSLAYAKGICEARGARCKTAAVYVTAQTRSLVDFFGECLNPLPDLPWKPSRSGDRIVQGV